MPTFADGSRIWIVDASGKPISEWQEEVTEDKALGTLTRSVYIPAEKGKFKVYYQMAKPPSVNAKRRKPKTGKQGRLPSEAMCQVGVSVDGQRARTIAHTSVGQQRSVGGWYSDATTLQHFAFGDVDTSEDSLVNYGVDKKAQLDNRCIEVSFIDAEVDFFVEPRPCRDPIGLAQAVHPDSKVASLVKLQVKPGSSSKLSAPQQTSGFKLKPKKGATMYKARFLYRPQSLLVAMSIMPDPADKGKRKQRYAGDTSDEGEDLEQRRKRLRAELRAVDKQLDKRSSQAGPSNDKHQDKHEGNKHVRSPVKKEGSKSFINLVESPKKQKIFLDLSAELE